jgi:type I restriction enzyme R subunit
MQYRRHLPHQVPPDTPIFLTWNLKGALPAEARARLQRERIQLEQEPPRAGESVRDRALRHGKLLFAQTDDFLDHATSGPLYLRDSASAQIVENAILFEANVRHALFAWCVMANHVHVLLKPIWKLPRITQSIKGFTARQINLQQQQVGRVFWQDESYDHWARDEEEMQRIIHYIETNPVSAGLCAAPADWPWSSARFRNTWPIAQPFQPDIHFPSTSPTP